MGLKRVRNIVANPEVALLLDRYRERWKELAYVLIQGTARILRSGPARERAIALLEERYPQYEAIALDSAPVIQITPRRFVPWGAVHVVPEDNET